MFQEKKHIREHIRGTFGHIRAHSVFGWALSVPQKIGRVATPEKRRGTFGGPTPAFYNNKREDGGVRVRPWATCHGEALLDGVGIL